MLRKQFKKSLALLLVLMMVMSLIPTAYFSAEEDMMSELTIRTSTSTSDWSNALLAGTVNTEGIEVFNSAKTEYDLPTVLDTTTQLRFFFNKGTNVESITLKWGEGFSKSKVFTTSITQWANCLEVGKNTLMLSVVGKDSSTKDYIFNIDVEPTLSELSLSANGAPIYLNEKFETKRTEYTANIPNTAKDMTVNAKAKSNDYVLQYNNTDYSIVDISNTDIISISVSASAIKTTYKVSLIKIQTFDVSINTIPNDSSIIIYDSYGAVLFKGLGHAEVNNLIGGEKYVVSKNGYITQSHLISSDNSIINVNLVEATSPSSPLPNYTGDWVSFRGNPENMGMTNAETPNSAETAVLKWAKKLGAGWSAAPTPPLIINDALYVAANSKVYKIDKSTGDILQESETLAGGLGFALNPITYGDGMIFVPIRNGRIQALRTDTLESLWVSEDMGSMAQSISPAMYHNGYVYTGTWNSGEESIGTYYCLSVTDEDINSKTETKLHSWKLNHKGGFYWAGAYVSDDYLLVGSDDGTSGYQSETAIFYSLNPRTGEIIDSINKIKGDIRSTVSFIKNASDNGGTAFFATKGGLFCTVSIDKNGKFIKESYKIVDLNGMCTGTPLVYNNRAYIGSSGAQQFGPGKLNVIDLSGDEPKLAYTADLPGYPQASALLSTAYGDTTYVYITYNNLPGGIYAIRDKIGQTEADGFNLFTPEKAQQQYSICSLVADRDGVIYYKNDSCYLMAVGTKSSYLEGLSSNIGQFDKSFASGTLSYELVVPTGTQSVILTAVPCDGGTFTINGTNSDEVLLADGKAFAEIVVNKDGIIRTYLVSIREVSSNAMLQNARANLHNSFVNEEHDFDLSDESASFSWHNDNKDTFRRIWVKPENSKATIKGFAVSGVSSSMNGLELEEGTELEAISGVGESIGYLRYNVYFADNKTESTIKLTVTAEDGISTKDYLFTLLRPTNNPNQPEEKISVTFRLIGSTLSDGDVDLGSPIGFAGAKYQTWISTDIYTLNKNAKVYDLFTMALYNAGLSYTGAEKNYVDAIWAPEVLGAYRLAEFTNGPRSGWMYTVNGRHPSFGLQEWTLNDGDIVVWHYVNDYSYEVSDWFDDDPAYPSLGNSSTWNQWLKAPDINPIKDNANSGSTTIPETNENENLEIKISTKVVKNEASSKVSEEQIKDAIEKTKKAKDVSSIIIKAEVKEAVTKSTVTIPKSSLTDISTEKMDLNIETAVGIISLPEKALYEISKQSQGNDVEIVIENIASNNLSDEQKFITEGRVVYDISILNSGKKISSFGGQSITISLPYELKNGQSKGKVSVWYMNDKGELEKINCTYDEKIGLVSFNTDHLSYYVVGYNNSISFTDVKESDWFYKNVEYVTSRGLFSGTSDNIFSTNIPMTRAMLVTVLHRLDGKPVSTKATSFADLVDGEFYIDAVNWSLEKGIVDGVTKTEFKPKNNVTREQLALMLYRYASSKNMVSDVAGSIEAFTDKDKVSDWAKDAIKWSVEKGIITGKLGNKLDPTGSATRAEVAAMLQRYIENVK